MQINIENLVSITEANQNFSKVARQVDEIGSVIILKNNKPKYILIDIEDYKRIDSVANDNISSLNGRILEDSLAAFNELVVGDK
ncbi:MAG: type II toxin-antitoxin system Phd/YefM family antitoxin [Eubacteriales bacterium]